VSVSDAAAESIIIFPFIVEPFIALHRLDLGRTGRTVSPDHTPALSAKNR
jgi:hypothetical protein